MRKILFVLFLIFLTSGIFCQTVEKVKDDLYKIQGDNYSAQIGDYNNGYLQNLIINGVEFLDQDMYTIVPRFEGFKADYLFNGEANKALKVNEIIYNDNKFICKTDAGDVIYTFFPNKINIDLDVKESKYINTIILKKSLYQSIYNNKGYNEYRFYPNCNDLIFVSEMTGIKLSGDCCSYGAWEGRQLILMDKNTPHLTIEPIILTQEQRNLIDNRKYIFLAEDITLYSPMEYEVFQRYSKEKGVIYISGKVSDNVKKLSYRIEGKDCKNKKYSTKWKEIKLFSNNFNKRLEIPAGGWYKLELKGNDNIIKTVQRFGVGEIIAASGQSNSTNCGQFYTKTETKMVSCTNGLEWKLGDDPQIGTADNYFGGGSLYPALGDALYKEFNVPIGIASLGCAGATINLFIPGEWVYNHNSARIARMGRDGFRAFIWIQGETDAVNQMPTDEYALKLKAIIENLHKDAGWNFPCFVANVSYQNNEFQSYEPIREGQNKVIKDKFAYQGVDMDTIGPEYRDVNHKGVHMTPEGLKKHGQMWADILIPFIHKCID